MMVKIPQNEFGVYLERYSMKKQDEILKIIMNILYWSFVSPFVNSSQDARSNFSFGIVGKLKIKMKSY